MDVNNVDVDMDVDKHTDVTKMGLSETLSATRAGRIARPTPASHLPTADMLDVEAVRQ